MKSLKALSSQISDKIKMSIRLKILVIFVMFAILPLGILGIISYNSYSSTIQETESRYTSEIANQLNRNLELLFSNINTILDAGEESLVFNYLDETDPDLKYEYAKELGTFFNLYRNIYNENAVLDINIIGINGRGISSRKGVYDYTYDLRENRLFQTALSNPLKPHIFVEDTVHSRRLRRIDSRGMISVAKVIRREVTREVKGLILVDMERKVIENICSNIKIGDTGKFIVADQDGNFVYYPRFQLKEHVVKTQVVSETDKSNEGYFTKRIDKEKYFIVYNKLDLSDWKIIGIVKFNEIMDTALDIRKWTIILEVFLVAGVILLYMLITRTITDPILDLRGKMEMAEAGDFNVKAAYKYNDEFSSLSKGFNRMIINISELMNKNAMQQENLKKLEFKALQAQINPHFLYNTLDAIVWTAEADKKEEVVNIAQNLSNFFRAVLSKGKEWILVHEEILHVESYLSIQKVRYRDILEYEIDIDPEIMNYSILKLVIQPLVENALYHGLKNKRGGGKIKVAGRKYEDNKIQLEVTDNGIGMTKEKLSQLEKEISQEEKTFNMNSGFGLLNVNQRIKLYYGSKYGLSIVSEYDKGTTVTVILPIIKQKPTTFAIQNKS